MKLLHVDASPKAEKSNSRALSQYFVEVLSQKTFQLEIDYLDLAKHPCDHVSGAFAKATYTAPEERTEDMKAVLAQSDSLCERVLAADAIVCAMPMHNWCYPSVFKTFIDNITRTGLTYVFGPNGETIGQLTRQKTLFITTRGADLGPGSPYQAMDALTPALTAAFGFLGVQNPEFVDAQPLQFANREAHEAAMINARQALSEVAEAWAASWEVGGHLAASQ